MTRGQRGDERLLGIDATFVAAVFLRRRGRHRRRRELPVVRAVVGQVREVGAAALPIDRRSVFGHGRLLALAPIRTRGARVSVQQAVDRRAIFLPRPRADEHAPDLPFLEQHHRRQRPHAVARGKLRIGVDVDRRDRQADRRIPVPSCG